MKIPTEDQAAMSIRSDIDYVGLSIVAVSNPTDPTSKPEPATIEAIVGLGDYVVRFQDGHVETVNEADIWDTIEDYESHA